MRLVSMLGVIVLCGAAFLGCESAEETAAASGAEQTWTPTGGQDPANQNQGGTNTTPGTNTGTSSGSNDDTGNAGSGTPVNPTTGAQAGTCGQLVDKLRTCGVLTEGEADCSEPSTTLSVCAMDCWLASDCAAVSGAVCGDQVAMDTIDACTDACGKAPCADGSKDISLDWFCDGISDCSDGSDEVGCQGFFQCADGLKSVKPEWQCDGYADCDDSSDEQGCAGFVPCADGSMGVPEKKVCDGWDNCPDASDEASCSMFTCADGSKEILLKDQCDGYAQCDDESDEAGCPAFMCADGSKEIPLVWQCDVIVDCPDGSDEAGCEDDTTADGGSADDTSTSTPAEPPYTCPDGTTIAGSWLCDGYSDCTSGADEQGCPPRAEALCATGAPTNNPPGMYITGSSWSEDDGWDE